jgi:hypothetical protein
MTEIWENATTLRKGKKRYHYDPATGELLFVTEVKLS